PDLVDMLGDAGDQVSFCDLLVIHVVKELHRRAVDCVDDLESFVGGGKEVTFVVHQHVEGFDTQDDAPLFGHRRRTPEASDDGLPLLVPGDALSLLPYGDNERFRAKPLGLLDAGLNAFDKLVVRRGVDQPAHWIDAKARKLHAVLLQRLLQGIQVFIPPPPKLNGVVARGFDLGDALSKRQSAVDHVDADGEFHHGSSFRLALDAHTFTGWPFAADSLAASVTRSVLTASL